MNERPAGIFSSLRTIDGYRIIVADPPRTQRGAYLAAALVADSSPRAGASPIRHVTTSLHLAYRVDPGFGPTVTGALIDGIVSPPTRISRTSVLDDHGIAALGTACFIAVSAPTSPGFRPAWSGGPIIDQLAEALFGAVADGLADSAGILPVENALRNPRGSMHGAAVYAALAFAAIVAVSGPEPGPQGQPAAAPDLPPILEGGVRYLRPVEDARVPIRAEVIHRSSRFVDVESRLGDDAEPLAVGRFSLLVARRSGGS
jgi:acyl-coenzyme A thioesterase PaaI-like protein